MQFLKIEANLLILFSGGYEKMDAERWIRQLEMMEKAKRDLRAKEKAQAAEEERIRQQAERRAWLRELR